MWLVATILDSGDQGSGDIHYLPLLSSYPSMVVQLVNKLYQMVLHGGEKLNWVNIRRYFCWVNIRSKNVVFIRQSEKVSLIT